MTYWSRWFDIPEDGLTRRVVKYVDLNEVPIQEWTTDEVMLRLAVLYPEVDGIGHETASDEVKVEINGLIAEIERRGYDWAFNLQYNERFVGFGWLPNKRKKAG